MAESARSTATDGDGGDGGDSRTGAHAAGGRSPGSAAADGAAHPRGAAALATASGAGADWPLSTAAAAATVGSSHATAPASESASALPPPPPLQLTRSASLELQQAEEREIAAADQTHFVMSPWTTLYNAYATRRSDGAIVDNTLKGRLVAQANTCVCNKLPASLRPPGQCADDVYMFLPRPPHRGHTGTGWDVRPNASGISYHYEARMPRFRVWTPARDDGGRPTTVASSVQAKKYFVKGNIVTMSEMYNLTGGDCPNDHKLYISLTVPMEQAADGVSPLEPFPQLEGEHVPAGHHAHDSDAQPIWVANPTADSPHGGASPPARAVEIMMPDGAQLDVPAANCELGGEQKCNGVTCCHDADTSDVRRLFASPERGYTMYQLRDSLALKVFDERHAEVFQHELDWLKRLDAMGVQTIPHVARLRGFSRAPGVLRMLFERYDSTLEALVSNDSQREECQPLVRRWKAQVAEFCDSMRERGYVHGNFTASNILVRRSSGPTSGSASAGTAELRLAVFDFSKWQEARGADGVAAQAEMDKQRVVVMLQLDEWISQNSAEQLISAEDDGTGGSDEGKGDDGAGEAAGEAPADADDASEFAPDARLAPVTVEALCEQVRVSVGGRSLEEARDAAKVLFGLVMGFAGRRGRRIAGNLGEAKRTDEEDKALQPTADHCLMLRVDVALVLQLQRSSLTEWADVTHPAPGVDPRTVLTSIGTSRGGGTGTRDDVMTDLSNTLFDVPRTPAVKVAMYADQVRRASAMAESVAPRIADGHDVRVFLLDGHGRIVCLVIWAVVFAVWRSRPEATRGSAPTEADKVAVDRHLTITVGELDEETHAFHRSVFPHHVESVRGDIIQLALTRAREHDCVYFNFCGLFAAKDRKAEALRKSGIHSYRLAVIDACATLSARGCTAFVSANVQFTHGGQKPDYLDAIDTAGAPPTDDSDVGFEAPPHLGFWVRRLGDLTQLGFLRCLIEYACASFVAARDGANVRALEQMPCPLSSTESKPRRWFVTLRVAPRARTRPAPNALRDMLWSAVRIAVPANLAGANSLFGRTTEEGPRESPYSALYRSARRSEAARRSPASASPGDSPAPSVGSGTPLSRAFRGGTPSPQAPPTADSEHWQAPPTPFSLRMAMALWVSSARASDSSEPEGADWPATPTHDGGAGGGAADSESDARWLPPGL